MVSWCAQSCINAWNWVRIIHENFIRDTHISVLDFQKKICNIKLSSSKIWMNLIWHKFCFQTPSLIFIWYMKENCFLYFTQTISSNFLFIFVNKIITSRYSAKETSTPLIYPVIHKITYCFRVICWNVSHPNYFLNLNTFAIFVRLLYVNNEFCLVGISIYSRLARYKYLFACKIFLFRNCIN